MKERFEKAWHGRDVWISLLERYKIDQSMYVIVLPDTKRIYNAPALSYLPVFLKKKGAQKAFVLTFDSWALAQQEQLSKNICMIECEKKHIDALIQFYCLYDFASNLIIASLEQPAGRMGCGIIGKKALSCEEVFAGVVYGLTELNIS